MATDVVLPQGWAVAENRALALRPEIIGLPLNYAALLIMACLFLALGLNLFATAGYTLAVGWTLGKLVAVYDPFAAELLWKSRRVPAVLWS